MSNDQPTTPTPPQETKKPNAIKAAWRRFKDRMKLTWIGWFYICARRTWGGSVLLFCLVLSLIPAALGLFGYLALRPYQSWDELPCQTGTLIKVHSAPGGRGESSATLRDAAGVEHKFYGGNFDRAGRSEIIPFLGQEIKMCYINMGSLLPPFYMKYVIYSYYPDGTTNKRANSSPAEKSLLHSKLIQNSMLWLTFPILLWLLKRHGREAWRERRSYRESLTSSHSNR